MRRRRRADLERGAVLVAHEHVRGWGCSVHETFPTFPTDWTALAVATDVPTAPTCGTDVTSGEAECGEAYILISGSGIVVTAPNLSLDPTTATNPVSHVAHRHRDDPGSRRRPTLGRRRVVDRDRCQRRGCRRLRPGEARVGRTARSLSPTRAQSLVTTRSTRRSRSTASADGDRGQDVGDGHDADAELSLDPPTDTNPVGTQHTVTATVTSSSSPLSGVLVSWGVTGANAGATGTCVPATARLGPTARSRSPTPAPPRATTRSTPRSPSAVLGDGVRGEEVGGAAALGVRRRG